MPVKVALIDSGLSPALAAALGGRLRAGAGFVEDAFGVVRRQAAVADPLGHGTQVAGLVLAAAPSAELINAQVFVAGRPVSAAAVAAALHWAVAQGAQVVNLSLGLHDDRLALGLACAAAQAAGVLLVASAPARGGPIYPASYPGVLAVSGDARCGDGEWSLINGLALVGASPQGESPGRAGGASFAAARISGLAAARFEAAGALSAPAFRSLLRAGASFIGRERHQEESAA
ncbi:MAG: S8 family serine peptidase [Rhodocyclales bacterium]|nr:S8 family serine peptidase [Rhodocyclales bacterium]